MFTLLSSCSILLLTLATTAQTELAKPEVLTAKIDAIAAEHLAKPGAAGLSIAVASKGKVLLAKGYGVADAEFDVPADASTMFRIGSVTKQFTAALILRYVEQGKLTLDDELSKYLPQFPQHGHEVNIRQLLNHTSGIPSYTDVGEAWERVWPLELDHAQLLALVSDKMFDFEPGEDWRYNNTGYYLLGMLIEKIGGAPYGEVLQKELFGPLGLKQTRYDSNIELIKGRAQGYTLNDGKLVNDQAIGMGQPGAAGGLISTGSDLLRWEMALVGGKVIDAKSFALMSTPTVLPDGRDTHYGFGLMLGQFAGFPRIQHGGGIFGFNSMLLCLPKQDLYVAVISNGEPISSAEIADAVSYAALAIVKPTAKDETIPAELLALLPGQYSIPAIKLDATLSAKDGKLWLQATGQDAFRLLFQGGLEFRAEFDSDVRVAFRADGKGFELNQGGGKFDATRK